MNVPPAGDTAKKLGAYFETLKVSQQPIPNMTVRISAGTYWGVTGATFIEYPGGNSPAITAPAVGTARWVLVFLTGVAVTQVLLGTATSNNPPVPSVPTGALPLAWVYVTGGTTQITDTMIYDARPTWVAGAGQLPNHNDLPGRSTSNAHPISAISDLQTALDDRVTIVDLNNELAAKADIGGTPNPTFKVNTDEVGVPGTNCTFGVERGTLPDVFLRWNEGTDIWEFTNDGTIWYPIATPTDIALAVSGSFVDVTGDTMTGILAMSGNKITSLGTPTLSTDAVNKTYVDTILAGSYQPLSASLTGLAALGVGTGFVVETAEDVFTNRTILGTAGNVSVSNGTGASGNPAIDLVDVGSPVASSFVKITTDAKGRVSGTTAVLTADIAALVDGTYVNVTGDTMTGVLVHPVGSAALPSITFTGDTNTGIYWSGADEVSISVGGVQKARVDVSGITVFSGFFTPGTGGAAAPEYTFTGDTDTGMYHPAANQLGLAVAGANSVLLTAAGATFAGNVTVTGTLTTTAGSATDLDMNGFKVTDLGAPTLGTDATTKTYVDTADALKVNKADTFALTGDVTVPATALTGPANSFAATLANTAVTAASYGSASAVGTFTVDAKGRLTAAATVPVAITGAAVTVGGFVSGHVVTLDASGHPVDSGIASTNVFLADGSVPATGNFDLDGNDLENVHSIIGVTVDPLSITAGNGVAGNGNDVVITGGLADTGFDGGFVTLTGGTANVSGSGGGIQVTGGSGAGAAQNGGGVEITGGAATTSGAAGSVTVAAGQSPSGLNGVVQLQTDGTDAVAIDDTQVVFSRIPVLPTYTTVTLPSAAANTAGIIFVSDANTGSGAIAFSNGGNWIDPSTGVPVAI